MQTWHIHIEGRVQGLGFRPFVYRLANQLKLTGHVSNTTDGLHIIINAGERMVDDFIRLIERDRPTSSKILCIQKRIIEFQSFDDFSIVESQGQSSTRLLITPDIALCENCRKELTDKKNRRSGYAFITCTECGPRYSVMKSLPYDRQTTTMHPFTMCQTCSDEYNDVDDRRFFSQTNSCPECGISLKWLTEENDDGKTIDYASTLLTKGKILAVKGIGGFLLLADATNPVVVNTLRNRKNRPSKPFACLFRDIKKLKKYVDLNKEEKDLLRSPEAPIVLVKIKDEGDLAVSDIAPGLKRIGAMLPYAPILQLIADRFRKPLIATSANASGSPIVYQDDEALRLLSTIADAILTNNREVAFPQDDSVLAFSTDHSQKIMLRRSRGYSPSVDFPSSLLPDKNLAFGAELKSAFAFTTEGNTYLSQYLGDTSRYESQESFNHVFSGMTKMMNSKPESLIVDNHPNYHTSQLGKEMAKNERKKLCSYQHHKAHFASLLAEHDLLESEEKILGVIWDGTGYGDDGHIWGGEFFNFEKLEMKRIGHLKYYPHLANNRMAREPKVATLAAMYPDLPNANWLMNHFDKPELDMLKEVISNESLMTSSVGRLFDAVAGLLEVKTENSFEGEAAMALQALAEDSMRRGWNPYNAVSRSGELDVRKLMSIIRLDVLQSLNQDIALKFHQTLVQWIMTMCKKEKASHVGFSGGVFQNSLLVDLIFDKMSSSYRLYFHEILPPNDENIAIGQLALKKIDVSKKHNLLPLKEETEEICV